MAKATKALTKWDEKFAAMAKKATKVVANVGVGNMIGLKSGQLTYKNNPVAGNKMNVVILGHILENDFYKGKYNPDKPEQPICYAFSEDEATLAPHPDSPEPQSKDCASCEQNVFGTAETGRGKACQNRVRMGMITEGDLEEAAKAEVAYLKVPVTSVKPWASYCRQLEDTLHRPPMGVVTEITVVPDPKTQFKVAFRVISKIDDPEQLEALMTKVELVEREIYFPYVQIEEVAVPARRNGKPVVNKKKKY